MRFTTTCKLFLALLLAVLVSACTDVERAAFSSYGEIHIVKLFAADGHVIQEWESTGKVSCSDGGICSFMDSKTKKLVSTTGDIVVFVK